jgi:UDP-N-acetylmuramoyl-tripeptide--D-alanyl-D-alanine ligase
MGMRARLKSVVVSLVSAEARAVLAKHKPRIVAVTGSVGKTSTKDAIFSVLKDAYKTRKSDKSFNSEIGIPLTILGLPNAWRNLLGWIINIVRGALLLVTRAPYPAWLVLEVGADRPGDIKKVSEWLHPDVAVLTLLPDVPVHVEYFRSPEEVAREKLYLADAITHAGCVVGNADDRAIADALKKIKKKTLSYGFSDGSTIRAEKYAVVYGHSNENENQHPLGVKFSVTCAGESHDVVLRGVVGRQHVYPALAAITVAKAIGIDSAKAVRSLGSHESAPGRMRVFEGIQGSVLIDDTYNSSPIALAEALSVLQNIECSGRRIVVVGDMLELGRYSVMEHTAIGKQIASFAHLLVTVGPRSRDTAAAAIASGMNARHVFEFADSKKAGQYLAHIIAKGDTVLVKGSQGMRMERISYALLSDKTKAPSVLVRQEREWKNR